MRLAVVGSRTFIARSMVEDYIAITYDKHADLVIVSGGARGADSIAASIANEIGLELVVFPADWERFGRSAGYKRNAQIVADADHLVAFFGPDGITPGTKSSIQLAYDKGIPIDVFFQSKPFESRHYAGKEN